VALAIAAGIAILGAVILNPGTANSVEPVALRPGKVATDFSLNLYSGGDFRLSEQRGKVVLVNFWASWCPPCREEAPVLEHAWRAFKDRGVVFVGVDIWDAEEHARAFLDEFDITYPNGPDPNGETAIEYGVTGVPETWILNREGRLVRRWVGALNDDQITAFLEAALQ